MNVHPITGFSLIEHVITKRERDYKKDYNRQKMREYAAKKKEVKNETI
jgi:hypothetical protein